MHVLEYAVPGWGRGELWLDGDRLLAHELPRSDRPIRARAGDEGRPLIHPRLRAAPSRRRREGSPLQQRILGYFGGARDDFRDVGLDLDWCTPFQRAVAEALRAVPYGETVTYGELAALAGYPNAHRAAGSFCARNRFGLFIPCHRVLAAGSLGSYGSLGVEYKRRLLALEGVVGAGGASPAPTSSTPTAAAAALARPAAKTTA